MKSWAGAARPGSARMAASYADRWLVHAIWRSKGFASFRWLRLEAPGASNRLSLGSVTASSGAAGRWCPVVECLLSLKQNESVANRTGLARD